MNVFYGVSINSIASFQYVAGGARSPLKPWLTGWWGEARAFSRLGRQPCRASGGSPWREGRQRWSHQPCPKGCAGDRRLHPVDKAGDLGWSCGWGLEPEAAEGAYLMSLHPGRAPCWLVAPFWEMLVSLPSRQSRAIPVVCCLPTSRLAFLPSAHSWYHWTTGLSSAGPIGTAFSLHPMREASFSILLPPASAAWRASPSGDWGSSKVPSYRAWVPAARAGRGHSVSTVGCLCCCSRACLSPLGLGSNPGWKC